MASFLYARYAVVCSRPGQPDWLDSDDEGTPRIYGRLSTANARADHDAFWSPTTTRKVVQVDVTVEVKPTPTALNDR